MEWQVCLRLLHITSSEKSNPRPFDIGASPYPLGHVLQVKLDHTCKLSLICNGDKTMRHFLTQIVQEAQSTGSNPIYLQQITYPVLIWLEVWTHDLLTIITQWAHSHTWLPPIIMTWPHLHRFVCRMLVHGAVQTLGFCLISDLVKRDIHELKI